MATDINDDLFEIAYRNLHDKRYRDELREALTENLEDAKKDGDAVRVEMFAAALVLLTSYAGAQALKTITERQKGR